MSNVVPLFGASSPAPPPSILFDLPVAMPAAPIMNVAARRFMELGELAVKLGMHDLSRRTLIEQLRGLHEHRGMPLPVNPRFVDGKPVEGADAIWARSKWDRGEILAWLDNGRDDTIFASEPAAPAAGDVATRSRLAANAARLCDQERRRA